MVIEPAIAVSLLIGLLTVGGSILGVRVSSREADTHDMDSAAKAWRDLLEPLRARIVDQEARIAELEAQCASFARELHWRERFEQMLRAQLIDAGIDPVTFPEVLRLEPEGDDDDR